MPSSASFRRHAATFWQRLVFVRTAAGGANDEPAGAGDDKAVDLYGKQGMEGMLWGAEAGGLGRFVPVFFL